MFASDTFLELPVELAGEIVGKWLSLKDVVHLDSSFCHIEKRSILHESVFNSPLCLVSVDILYFPEFRQQQFFSWLSSRLIRVGTLQLLKSGVPLWHKLKFTWTACETYLRSFGQYMVTVKMNGHSEGFIELVQLLISYCRNI